MEPHVSVIEPLSLLFVFSSLDFLLGTVVCLMGRLLS